MRLSHVLVPLLVLAASAYRIVDLGLPPGAEAIYAYAINGRGEVLVSTPGRNMGIDDNGDTIYRGARGYLWRAGRFLDFGGPSLSQPQYQPNIAPNALNDHSVVVGTKGFGGRIFNSELSDVTPFIWRGKGLGDFAGPGWTGVPVAINDLGDIVGRADHRAFARLNGRFVWLPNVSHVESRDPRDVRAPRFEEGVPKDVATADAINERRQILMTATFGSPAANGDLRRRPYLVDGNTPLTEPSALPLPKGYDAGYGYALNDRGTVLAVAVHFVTGGVQMPFLVRDGQIVRLPFAGPMNGRNEVVGGSPLSVWQSGKSTPLPAFPGWTLQSATGINDQGAICGTGLHDGKTRAYVLLPQR